MRFLLDTQVWLWMHLQPERLRPEVRDQFVDPASTLLLSAASSWEIAIKFSLGKLPLPEPPYDYVSSRMRRDAVDGLPVPIRMPCTSRASRNTTPTRSIGSSSPSRSWRTCRW